MKGLSVIIPSFNEAGAIEETLTALRAALNTIGMPSEVIVVDDGSADRTAEIVTAAGVMLIRHPMNCGYGRSLLTGIEAATYDAVAILDADGTYPVEKLPDLVAFYQKGFHMAVAARTGKYYVGSFSKRLLRGIFRWLVEYTCGRDIPDINSGFRVFDRRPVIQWRASLSMGFSFTTTVTLLFMLNNLLVGYMPIAYNKRIGSSKVRMVRDSLRSLQIIATSIAQFNPLKLFLLLGVFNILGNLLLLTYFLQNGSTALLLFFSFFWNTLSVIASTSILSLSILKPSGTALQIPPAS